MSEYGKVHTEGSRSGEQKPQQKLLTEAELIERLTRLGVSEGFGPLLDDFRERGLIAPEPVDPKRLLARKAVADYCKCDDESQVSEHCVEVEFVMMGMELAQPKLTRKMVRDAVGRVPCWIFERSSRDTISDHIYEALTGDFREGK